MKKILILCLLASMGAISSVASAAFVDETTDQVSATQDEPKRAMPITPAANLTETCISHLRTQGYVFQDKALTEKNNDAHVASVIAEKEAQLKPVVVTKTELVPMQVCPEKAPVKKPIKKKSKKKAKKPVKVTPACPK